MRNQAVVSMAFELEREGVAKACVKALREAGYPITPQNLNGIAKYLAENTYDMLNLDASFGYIYK